MVSGLWLVVSGQWTVDSGQGTLGRNGQRAVVSAVVSGQWAVVGGQLQWLVVSGLC